MTDDGGDAREIFERGKLYGRKEDAAAAVPALDVCPFSILRMKSHRIYSLSLSLLASLFLLASLLPFLSPS